MLPLEIRLRPSRFLAAALCALHGAAAGCVVLAAIPVWLQAALCAAVAASLALGWRRHAALRHPASIVGLRIHRDGRLTAGTRDGEHLELGLLGTSYVSGWLVVLNLAAAGERVPRHAVLVPDNVDPDDFRRFRTWLRWGDATAAAPDPEEG